MGRWTFRLAVAATVAASAAAAVWWWQRPSGLQQLQQARRALIERDYARAEALSLAVAGRRGADPWAWMVAAEAAVRAGRLNDGLAHYERVTDGSQELRAAAAYGRGEVCLQLGRLERAEQAFRTALDIDPHSLLAQRRLVELFNLTGRRQDAVPWLEQLIRTPAGTLEDLFYLGDVDHALAQDAAIWTAIRDPQADSLLVQGAAYQALAENRAATARELFERVLAVHPNNVDSLAGLGEALLQSALEQLPGWRARLNPATCAHPGIAAVLGQWADREERAEEAVGWYARVVERLPTSRIAWHRLGQSLSRLGRHTDAELALDRARELQKVAVWLDDLFDHREHLDLTHRVAEQLAILGRSAEATAWARRALAIKPNQAWALQLLSQLEQSSQALADSARQAALADLVNRLARQSVAIEPERQPRQPAAAVVAESVIHFDDVAASTGLEFTYYAARQPHTRGARIIETAGGGVGVIDYDGDGWPDLFFTQGGREFPLPADHPDRDRLFRNQSGRHWVDVSTFVGIDDADFGQGVAAGDFNNDGFTDLYVANYGVNRLLQNQGDGTFRDVTPTALREAPVWTSSCAIADLNGDGWPDLFDVTYCRGRDVETRRCDKQGVIRSCSPRAFRAETDRLWLSTGDGGWIAATDCGLDLLDGYGLGLVVFRPVPEAPLGVFVANDETPNYWLVLHSRERERPESVVHRKAEETPVADAPGSPRFTDQALLGGLAVDANGQSQACMGVACDDANGDGLPDLFVTNFNHESNTLYIAINSEFYEDRTRAAQLREPSWNMLGFGTQFVDADLDGWPDLLIANGHIDDLTAQGEPFQMPLQCFRNLGGTFRELTAQEAGECFARPALGRGLARLDWNRDGREDAIVVNQESPAVLLENDSQTKGHSLTLQFRATRGARDAIGTIVRTTIGPRTLTRQLTAGDGYQASNERQLVIGLGDAAAADVEVVWPKSAKQTFTGLNHSTRYLLIEERSAAVVIER